MPKHKLYFTARTRGVLMATASLLLGSVVSTSALAQTSAQEGGSQAAAELGEIVVTAQRRDQRLSDVPIAITAVTGEGLRERKIESTEDLVRVTPNLGISAFYPSRPEVSIRGVAMSESFQSTDQQPVGVFQDEVFQGARGVHMAQMFDLERVEIVRGPQGILFGRNTTAGAISFFSKTPEPDFGGYVTASYGNFDTYSAEAAVNVPLAEGLAARVSGMYRHADGWATNVFTGNEILGSETYALRGVLQYKGEAVTVRLNVHGSRYSGDMNYYFAPDIPGLAYDETAQRLEAAPDKVTAFGANLTAELDLGDVKVTSITGYEKSTYYAREDYGHGPSDINNAGQFVQFNPFAIGYDDDFKQVSQELRLSGSSGDFEWVAGAFAYYEDVASIYSDGGFGYGTIGFDLDGSGFIDAPDEGFFPEDDQRIFRQKTREVAGFVHGNYALSPQLSVLGGLRYTHSKKELVWQYTDVINHIDLVPQARRERAWNALSVRLGVEYRPQEGVLLYGRYDRGFKSGGFNVGGTTLEALTTVDPETVDSYEAGAKIALFDRRAQINIAAFHNTIKDYQANISVFTPTGLSFAFQNAARVRTQGIEFELNVTPVPRLILTTALGYTDAVYKEYFDEIANADYSGNRIPNTPEYSATGSAQYTWEFANGMSLTPRADVSYTSAMEGRQYNRATERNAAKTIVNGQLRLELPGEALALSLWAKNLTNERYTTKRLDDVFSGGLMEKRGLPRTYGVTLDYRW